jgi:hypothetical protein
VTVSPGPIPGWQEAPERKLDATGARESTASVPCAKPITRPVSNSLTVRHLGTYRVSPRAIRVQFAGRLNHRPLPCQLWPDVSHGVLPSRLLLVVDVGTAGYAMTLLVNSAASTEPGWRSRRRLTREGFVGE